jgi:hypothetical protein
VHEFETKVSDLAQILSTQNEQHQNEMAQLKVWDAPFIKLMSNKI